MGKRTIQLDEEAEETLGGIGARIGLSVSAALKRGLIVLREEVVRTASTVRHP